MAQEKYSPLLSSGLFCGPSNTMGMGNPQAPEGNCELTKGIGDTAGDFHSQEPGSGDLIV